MNDAENVAYTSRGINSPSARVKCFCFVVLCAVGQQPLMLDAMQKCYDYVEVGYCLKNPCSVAGSLHIFVLVFVRAAHLYFNAILYFFIIT